MLEIQFDNKFKKDYKRCLKRGCKPSELETVLKLLASESRLPAKYRDHSLVDSRNYKGVRECHINPDWLLIYKIEKELLIIRAIRTGTHSDLF